VTFKLNYARVGQILHGDAGIDKALTSRAEKMLAVAKAIAPVKTGAYRASLHVETVQHPTRMVARIVASAPHAHLVERKNSVLAKALAS